MKHVGIILPNGEKEIVLECTLLSRASRKPYQDPHAVRWVETAGRTVDEVATEVQQLYDEMAGPFACRKVDKIRLADLIAER